MATVESLAGDFDSCLATTQEEVYFVLSQSDQSDLASVGPLAMPVIGLGMDLKACEDAASKILAVLELTVLPQ